MCRSCSFLFLLQPKELDPSAVLPLDCLLAFVFFDANWCGYLHRRDLERVLLTLGLRLSAEQVPAPGPPRPPVRRAQAHARLPRGPGVPSSQGRSLAPSHQGSRVCLP